MATTEEAKKILLRAFLAFPTSGNEKERRLKFEAYWAVLGNQFPRHVIQACEYVMHGRGDDGAEFMPSAAQFYRLAQDFAAREARDAPKKLNSALIESRSDRDERARVIKGFDNLAIELAKKYE